MALTDLDPDEVTTEDILDHVAAALNWPSSDGRERARALLTPVANQLLSMPGAEREEILLDLAGLE